MKKLNNKGFAISTLIYGLMLVAFIVVALLMSIMSTNRKNTSTLIKKIEEELNRYSQTATEITSTDGAQEFIVPYGQAGWYKIELWGAPAENSSPTNPAKLGSYTSGVIYLEENQHLYFYIGTNGTSSGGNTQNTDYPISGGSTDVRLKSGTTWKENDSLESRIMIAAGGGYSTSKLGGGLQLEPDFSDYSNTNYYKYSNDGGSYISGFAGQKQKLGFQFINPIMYSGVSSAGKAKIELVSKTEPPKKTEKLNNVRFIKDCIHVESTMSNEYWREIQAIDTTGGNVAAGKTAMYSGTTIAGLTDEKLDSIPGTITSSSTGEKCIVVDLGTIYNLEEIAIFHHGPSEPSTTKVYKNENISVSSDGLNYTSIKGWTDNYAPVETYMGVRISAKTPENSNIPTGNYFIQSAMSDTRIISVESDISILLNLANIRNNQKFSITEISPNQYKILESAELKTLLPNGTSLKTEKDAIGYWEINPVSQNGYYQISNTGQCITSPTSRDTNGDMKLEACNDTKKNQWFKLINADY